MRQGQIPIAAMLAATRPLSMFAPRFASSRDPSQASRLDRGPAIRPDLFAAPLPVGDSAISQSAGSNAAPPPQPLASLSFPNDPLANFTYVGFVTVEGRTMALIENRTTHEGWYVAEGDLWQNGRIASVGPDEISFLMEGKRRTMAKSDAFSAVPLLADAPGTGPLVALQESSLQEMAASIDGTIALKLEGDVLIRADSFLTNSVTLTSANTDLDIIDSETTAITKEIENSAPQAAQPIIDVDD